MKKVLCAVLLLVMSTGCAFAGHRVGIVIKNIMTPEGFSNFLASNLAQVSSQVLESLL